MSGVQRRERSGHKRQTKRVNAAATTLVTSHTQVEYTCKGCLTGMDQSYRVGMSKNDDTQS